MPESLLSFRLLLIRSTEFFLRWFFDRSFSHSRTLFDLLTLTFCLDGNRACAELISSLLFSRFLSTLTILTEFFSADQSSSLSYPFSSATVLSSIIRKSFSFCLRFRRPPSMQQHSTTAKIATSPTAAQTVPITTGLSPLVSETSILIPLIFVPLLRPSRHPVFSRFEPSRSLSSLRLLLDSNLFVTSKKTDLLTREDFSDSIS